MKVEPVDLDEAAALVINLLISQLVIVVAGCAGSVVLAGVTSGDWAGAALGFGWLRSIADSLCALSAAQSLVLAALLGAVFCVAAYFWERRAFAKGKRAEVVSLRRGINGELPRLLIVLWIVLMTLAGFAEELLFRFALLGLAIELLAGVLPDVAAAVAAVVVSSLLFWIAHVRYRSLASTVATLLLGVALGAAFLATGSLAVAAGAHALYNVGVLAIARFRMNRDPDYFAGPAPKRVLLDQLENERGERATL